MDIPPEQLEICLSVLQKISEDPALISQHDRFKSLIAKIHKQGRRINRQTERIHRQSADRQLRATTLIIQAQQPQQAVLTGKTSTSQEHLQQPAPCYICKQPYTQLHFFYHALCPECAKFNYQKRHQRADLTGRIALVTGGRIKIGYQVALRLLRDGARVIVTTRFPRDAAHRYSLEPDFEQWSDRLQIHGLDLRNISVVEALVQPLWDTEPSLDILINNAAQTIKRPLAFYQHLLGQERQSLPTLSAIAQALIHRTSRNQNVLFENHSSNSKDLPVLQNPYFPPQIFDIDGQQLDLRPMNSWRIKLAEVSTLELLEVQLVNAIAPFILTSKLKPLFLRSPHERRFIIQVSAMEGQFSRENKTPHHPHTNMAKAALNMMTRTSAPDYAQDNIFMNSVDTGWITDENPYPKKIHLQTARGFYTPLDVIDGMARIYDPIVQGLKHPHTPLFGYFLKDYIPHPW